MLEGATNFQRMHSKKNNNLYKILPVYLAVLFLYNSNLSCVQSTSISEISLSLVDNNPLKVKIAITNAEPADAFIQYWRLNQPTDIYSTYLSINKKRHSIVLTNLKPKTQYQYKIITIQDNKQVESKVYDFETQGLPFWMEETFPIINPQPESLPGIFKKGLIMLYQREEPGILYFINYKGEIVWYHKIENAGFKVAHFTKSQSILSIIGNSSYETSYGNQILELSLTGDTLLHLKLGDNDFSKVIHHEIILSPDNNIATLTVEEKIIDLSSIGGKKNDTLKTDGIIVLDREGRQLWHWTVLDVLDARSENNILKEKRDWMHANSLTYTPDGNFLISFYNNGQIWKVNSTTGELIWKLGKGGDFKTNGSLPEKCHAVHWINDSTLILFDNGTSNRTSRVYIMGINEQDKIATIHLDMPLPKDSYNERMGSAYEVGDSSILICASKRNSIILSKPDGRYLWLLNTKGISPYRAEFIQGSQIQPYISEEE